MGTMPDGQQRTRYKTTTTTLAAGIAAQIVPANAGRNFLLIANTGTGSVTIKEDAAPVSAGLGMCLDPASTSGGQGGSFLEDEVVPDNAFWGLSAVGTTVSVTEG